MMRRRVAGVWLGACFALSACVVFLGGCSWTPWAGETRETSYGGPPLEVVSKDGSGYVLMRAPHAGWTHGLDRVERTARGVVVYVTVEEPDPGRMYTQAITEQWLAVGVSEQDVVGVMARVQRFGKSGAEPYFEVVSRER